MVAKYFLLKGLFGVLGLVFVFFVVSFFFLASCRASHQLGVDQLCSKRADHSVIFARNLRYFRWACSGSLRISTHKTGQMRFQKWKQKLGQEPPRGCKVLVWQGRVRAALLPVPGSPRTHPYFSCPSPGDW